MMLRMPSYAMYICGELASVKHSLIYIEYSKGEWPYFFSLNKESSSFFGRKPSQALRASSPKGGAMVLPPPLGNVVNLSDTKC